MHGSFFDSHHSLIRVVVMNRHGFYGIILIRQTPMGELIMLHNYHNNPHTTLYSLEIKGLRYISW